MVGGASATANVIFGDPTNLVNDQVTVTDDMYGNLGTYAASAGISYTWLFDCDDAGENVNTATIVETGQYDQATVDVYCYSLNVSKDAATSLTRTYDWWAEKLGSDESLVLAPGQVYDVTYQIQVFCRLYRQRLGRDGEYIYSEPGSGSGSHQRCYRFGFPGYCRHG
jgi:hypothetical protein